MSSAITEVVLLIILLPSESDTIDDRAEVLLSLRDLGFRFENRSFVVRFKQKFFKWM